MTRVMLSLMFVAILTGCETFGGGGKETADTEAAVGQAASDAATRGLAAGEGAAVYEVQTLGTGAAGEAGQAGPDQAGLLARRTLYFDFDRAQVRPEDIPVVQAHARYLMAHPQLVVTLEGHTDERGSREYNIALGEARAKSVAKLLELSGVLHRRIRVISYGEEKPLALGHDEAAWQKNRRVEIVYGG